MPANLNKLRFPLIKVSDQERDAFLYKDFQNKGSAISQKPVSVGQVLQDLNTRFPNQQNGRLTEWMLTQPRNAILTAPAAIGIYGSRTMLGQDQTTVRPWAEEGMLAQSQTASLYNASDLVRKNRMQEILPQKGYQFVKVIQKRAAHSFFNKGFIKKSDKVLEIGGAYGAFRKELMKVGVSNVVSVELDANTYKKEILINKEARAKEKRPE